MTKREQLLKSAEHISCLSNAVNFAIDHMSDKDIREELHDFLFSHYINEATEIELEEFLILYGKAFKASLTGKDSPCK